MATVAFIDDEEGPIDYYVQALSDSGHQVERLETVEKVFDHLGRGTAADIYVVDIMMPTHGHPRLKQAASGLASGIVLHKEIRRCFPQVPIIMLTSIANPEILEGLSLKPNTQLESKIDTLPFDLVAKVEAAIKATIKY